MRGQCIGSSIPSSIRKPILIQSVECGYSIAGGIQGKMVVDIDLFVHPVIRIGIRVIGGEVICERDGQYFYRSGADFIFTNRTGDRKSTHLNYSHVATSYD